MTYEQAKAAVEQFSKLTIIHDDSGQEIGFVGRDPYNGRYRGTPRFGGPGDELRGFDGFRLKRDAVAFVQSVPVPAAVA
jgi:hypothetical protein